MCHAPMPTLAAGAAPCALSIAGGCRAISPRVAMRQNIADAARHAALTSALYARPSRCHDISRHADTPPRVTFATAIAVHSQRAAAEDGVTDAGFTSPL